MAKKKFIINTSGGRVKRMKVPFTQVANSVLREPGISLKAKGLYSLMYSKPNGYVFDSMRLSKESKDGRDAVRTAMLELIRAGFMTRSKKKTGRCEYELSYPVSAEAEVEEDNYDSAF